MSLEKERLRFSEVDIEFKISQEISRSGGEVTVHIPKMMPVPKVNVVKETGIFISNNLW
jgi:hypothetical protein